MNTSKVIGNTPLLIIPFLIYHILAMSVENVETELFSGLLEVAALGMSAPQAFEVADLREVTCSLSMLCGSYYSR